MENAAGDDVRTHGGDGRGLKVFISYSRRDLDFADQLALALETLAYTVIIDRKGIHGAEKWEARLGQMILEADTVVFVLTPASAASDVCRWEVDQALACRKRIVPVLAAPLDGATPHEVLRDLNHVHFYPEPASPGAGWGGGLARLHAALGVDIEWIREHTRVAEMAARWETEGRIGDFLARGSELAKLQRWRDARPANAPELSPAQRAFLHAAEEAEACARDEARRQIEAVRAAQEARAVALEASSRAQDERATALRTIARRTRWGMLAAVVLSSVAGVASVVAYRNGEQARQALAQIRDERNLQDRLIRLAGNRDPLQVECRVDILARRYEGETADHIGTDFLGGVYYGVYRIKAGRSMASFMAFLRLRGRPFHDRLVAAGGAEAAAAQAEPFVAAWRQLATAPQSASEFADLQLEFVRLSNYQPLINRLASPPPVEGRRPVSLQADERSFALRAVLFSVAVQYGPATRLVEDALGALEGPQMRSDAQIIAQLYRFRDKVDVYFPEIRDKSPNFVALIRERNHWEQKDALQILDWKKC